MYDEHAAWALHPQVAVRPEPFGALLYHFGNRRLSFVKDRGLLAVVQSLGTHPSADAAVSAVVAGRPDPDRDRRRYHRALAGLVASDLLTRRDDSTG